MGPYLTFYHITKDFLPHFIWHTLKHALIKSSGGSSNLQLRKPQMPRTIPDGTIILSILFCLSRNRADRTSLPNTRMIVDTDDDTTNCPVCTEFYEENEDHLPLRLPCSHSLCHSCAAKLLKNGKLECPQDRLVHNAKGGYQMFPQNKYIIKNLEKKLITKEANEYEICPKHHRDKNLFCKNSKCQVEICSICMKEGHSQHNTVDSLTLKSQMVQEIIHDVKELLKNIGEYEGKITATHNQVSFEFTKQQEYIKAKMDTFHCTVQSKLNELKEVDRSLETLKNVDDKNLRFKDLAQARKSVNDAKVKVASCVNKPLKFDFCNIKEKKMNVNLKTKKPEKDVILKVRLFSDI